MSHILALLISLGSAAQGCTPGGSELVTKPSHEQVSDAVRRSADKELERLVTGPGSYVLRLEPRPGVAHHELYRVLLTETDHPMSFWLAVPHGGAPAVVLSRNLAALHAFFGAEPALLADADLPSQFHDLFRHQGVRSRLLTEPAPRIERGPDGVRLDLAVDEEGETLRWQVWLPTDGTPTLRETPAGKLP